MREMKCEGEDQRENRKYQKRNFNKRYKDILLISKILNTYYLLLIQTYYLLFSIFSVNFLGKSPIS